jgi:hypothetical protein
MNGIKVGHWIKDSLLAYFPYFEKNEIRLMKSRCCLCMPPIVAWQRLGKIPLIVARQRLDKHPLTVGRQRLDINPLIVARQRLIKNPPIVARQRLGKNLTTVTNTHATIEELLDASFSMWPVSYQRK